MPVHTVSPSSPLMHQPITERTSHPQPIREASYPQPIRESSHLDNTHSQLSEDNPFQPITGSDSMYDPMREKFTGNIPGGLFVTVEKHTSSAEVNKHVTSTPHAIRTGDFLYHYYFM